MEAWGAAEWAETGPTMRCAMYDMNRTKITAPMAAPIVRVTVIPSLLVLRIRLMQGKGSARVAGGISGCLFSELAPWAVAARVKLPTIVPRGLRIGR
jgi:hypothetical protein